MTKGQRHRLNMGPLYGVWANMLNRCRNPRDVAFKFYGGRGIAVCERWQSFKSFAADVGPRPDGTELDRIDNNGPYCPGNTRWTTHAENCRNRRAEDVTKRPNAILVDVGGDRVVLAEAIRRRGMNRQTVYARIRRGWTVERALT